MKNLNTRTILLASLLASTILSPAFAMRRGHDGSGKDGSSNKKTTFNSSILLLGLPEPAIFEVLSQLSLDELLTITSTCRQTRQFLPQALLNIVNQEKLESGKRLPDSTKLERILLVLKRLVQNGKAFKEAYESVLTYKNINFFSYTGKYYSDQCNTHSQEILDELAKQKYIPQSYTTIIKISDNYRHVFDDLKSNALNLAIELVNNDPHTPEHEDLTYSIVCWAAKHNLCPIFYDGKNKLLSFKLFNLLIKKHMLNQYLSWPLKLLSFMKIVLT